MSSDRKTDRHQPGRQYPVSLRLDKGDYDALETRRAALGISRRQAIIAAIREWAPGAPWLTCPACGQSFQIPAADNMQDALDVIEAHSCAHPGHLGGALLCAAFGDVNRIITAGLKAETTTERNPH